MSEFNLPIAENKLLTSSLLTNITNSSIALQLYNISNDDGEQRNIISNFTPNKTVFYEDIVELNPDTPFYNKDKIDAYISEKILSSSAVTPTLPSVDIQGVPGSTSIFSVTKHNAVIKNSINNNLDSLECFYGTDTANNIKIIVYKNLNSFSYTLNRGKSIIEIPSNGLLYFDEITSVAIQTYHNGNAYTGIPKIWIGTLREGLKSYTIGDSFWVAEGSGDYILGTTTTGSISDNAGVNPVSCPITDISYLFKHSITNTYAYVRDSGLPSQKVVAEYSDTSGNPLKYKADGFAPCYIISLNNAPISAGNPIIVFCNTNIDGASSPKYIFKYLATSFVKYVTDPLSLAYSQVPTTAALSNIATSWTICNSTNTINFTSLPTSIYDVLKTTSFKTSHSVSSVSSNLTTVSVLTDGRFYVELYSIAASMETPTAARKLSVIKFTDVGASQSIAIETQNFSGISSYSNSGYTEIFLTERMKVWRCSNSLPITTNINGWYSQNGFIQPWISADDTQDERNFRIRGDYSFAIEGSVSYLSGLRGFGILKASTSNDLIGLINTDFGMVSLKLVSTTNDFLAQYVDCKTLRRDLFGSFLTDLCFVNETNEVISCGLKTTPIIQYTLPEEIFNVPIRYLVYTPVIKSTLPVNLHGTFESILFYRNYWPVDQYGPEPDTNSSSPLINASNYLNSMVSNIQNPEQIYDATMTTPEIHILKVFPNIPYYIAYNTTLGNKFSYFSNNINLLHYLTFTPKYNTLKLALQVTEIPAYPLDYLPLVNTLILPYLPDIDNQFDPYELGGM